MKGIVPAISPTNSNKKTSVMMMTTAKVNGRNQTVVNERENQSNGMILPTFDKANALHFQIINTQFLVFTALANAKSFHFNFYD